MEDYTITIEDRDCAVFKINSSILHKLDYFRRFNAPNIQLYVSGAAIEALLNHLCEKPYVHSTLLRALEVYNLANNVDCPLLQSTVGIYIKESCISMTQESLHICLQYFAEEQLPRGNSLVELLFMCPSNRLVECAKLIPRPLAAHLIYLCSLRHKFLGIWISIAIGLKVDATLFKYGLWQKEEGLFQLIEHNSNTTILREIATLQQEHLDNPRIAVDGDIRTIDRVCISKLSIGASKILYEGNIWNLRLPPAKVEDRGACIVYYGNDKLYEFLIKVLTKLNIKLASIWSSSTIILSTSYCKIYTTKLTTVERIHTPIKDILITMEVEEDQLYFNAIQIYVV